MNCGFKFFSLNILRENKILANVDCYRLQFSLYLLTLIFKKKIYLCFASIVKGFYHGTFCLKGGEDLPSFLTVILTFEQWS